MNKAERVLASAQADIGTYEVVGSNHNLKILNYFHSLGHKEITSDETPWCAAFIGYHLEKNGVTSTKALNARSYETFGTAVALKDAKPGDICVFKRGSSSWMGHVTFFLKYSNSVLYCIGGNQSDSVRVSSYSVNDLITIRRYK